MSKNTHNFKTICQIQNCQLKSVVNAAVNNQSSNFNERVIEKFISDDKNKTTDFQLKQ